MNTRGTCRKFLAFATIMFGYSLMAEAQAIVPSCRNSGSAKVGCSFPETVIAQPILDSLHPSGTSQPTSSDFFVKYDFDCRGHRVGLAFVSSSATAPTVFTAGGHEATVALSEGTGPLVLRDVEIANGTTYRATLLGSCSLNIREVTVFPSFSTLERWKTLANSLADNIRDNLQAYLDAKNVQTILDWDKAEMERFRVTMVETLINPLLLPYKLEFSKDVLNAQGEQRPLEEQSPEYRMAKAKPPFLIGPAVDLWQYMDDVLKGRPPSGDTELLDEAVNAVQGELAARTRSRLEKRVKAGAEVAALLKSWQEKLRDEQKTIYVQIHNELVQSCADAAQTLAEVCANYRDPIH